MAKTAAVIQADLRKKGSEIGHTDTLIAGIALASELQLVTNIITVCANHHRQFHYGDIQVNNNTQDHLEITIDGKTLDIKKA